MSIHTDRHLPASADSDMQGRVLARVEAALARRVDGTVPAATVRSVVADVVAEFTAHARHTTYLPALVEHEAGRRVAALAKAPVDVAVQVRHAVAA